MTGSIIEEVRAIREQHAASLDYDLDKIYADLKARQENHAAEGWIVVPPPANPPSEPKWLCNGFVSLGVEQIIRRTTPIDLMGVNEDD